MDKFLIYVPVILFTIYFTGLESYRFKRELLNTLELIVKGQDEHAASIKVLKTELDNHLKQFKLFFVYPVVIAILLLITTIFP